MAYDEELADRLRLLLSSQGVTEKKMFGGLAFLVDGHMALAAIGDGGIMVRVDPAESESLRGEDGAEPVEMQGRSLKGWLQVGAAPLEDDAALRRWADRGVAFVGSLPPK
jgi:TfoX/Sxy family transcriptional regulator of competence genes